MSVVVWNERDTTPSRWRGGRAESSHHYEAALQGEKCEQNQSMDPVAREPQRNLLIKRCVPASGACPHETLERPGHDGTCPRPQQSTSKHIP